MKTSIIILISIIALITIGIIWVCFPKARKQLPKTVKSRTKKTKRGIKNQTKKADSMVQSLLKKIA